MSFINVLIDILNRFDATTYLDINVTVITHQKSRVIGNNPSIVQPPFHDKNLLSILTPSINRICILSLLSGITKLAWILETTLAIHHACTMQVESSTRAMHHVCADKSMED